METVLLDENGHVVGLGHSDVTGAVMEPYYGGEQRALHQNYIDGIRSLYPAGPANGSPTVDITSPADAPVFGCGATS